MLDHVGTLPDGTKCVQASPVELMALMMIARGKFCRHCGGRTRVTSKKWARCKACGARVERMKVESLADIGLVKLDDEQRKDVKADA